MNLSFYIASRYLFSKKSHNAINIISAISACGIALATLAMVCTLSVFNGFQDMVGGLFTAFDPQLKITAAQGKVFNPHESRLQKVKSLPEIDVWMETLEESALVKYKDQQVMVTIKGVEDNFEQLTAIDSILYGSGSFKLKDDVVYYGIPGAGVASQLGTGVEFTDPLTVYVPKRNVRINIANPSTAFIKDYLYSPGSVFMVSQDKYDSNFILTSLDFARSLYNYDEEVSAVELKFKSGADEKRVQKNIENILGERFTVSDRFEQQSDVFKIMRIEKLISYIFLVFILSIASFNIIGSLSILIVDKRDDADTLHGMGASGRQIEHVFMFEGWLISALGALAGIVGGVLLCFAQQQFGIISLNGNFLVDAYPVSVQITDLVVILLTVMTTSALSVAYPVKYICKRLLKRE